MLEAHALYDFKARSSREVNFRKGDTILLYRQVSNDWWRGSVDGREGLIHYGLNRGEHFTEEM